MMKQPSLGGGALPPMADNDSKRAAERRIAPEPDLHEDELEVEDEEEEESEGSGDKIAIPYPAEPGGSRDSFWTHTRQQAEIIRRQDYGYQEAQTRMLEVLAEMPKYIPAGFLEAYNLGEGDDLDAPKYTAPEDQQWMQGAATAQEVRAVCSELDPIRQVRMELRWFCFKRRSRGRMLTGNARVVSLQDRACYAGQGKAPLFQVELSLAAWLVSTAEQKRAMLHQALYACEVHTGRSGQKVARKRQPDVVAYTTTLMRFGLTDRQQAKAMLAMQQHPRTAERLEKWEIEPDGQGILFPAYKVPESKTL